MRSWGPATRLASLLASACTRNEASSRPRADRDVEPPTEGYYDAGGDVPAPLSRETLAASADVVEERIRLPARVPPELRPVPLADDPIEILHHRPAKADGRSRPLIVMSPMLGNTTLLVRGVARRFARGGLHAAIVQRKELDFDPRVSVAQAEQEVRSVVMRSRQAVDWLLQQEGVDRHRMGSFGVSAGAIVSSMLAGADARLSAHVWLLAGGPLSHVMAHTVEGRFRGYAREAIRTTGRRLSEIRGQLRETIRTDPLQLAARVAPEDVLLVLARFDRSVPYRYGLALWRALGRPARVLCPFGHYTSLALLPWMQHEAVRFFQRRWGGVDPG